MNKKLIPIKIENPSVFRNYSHDSSDSNLEYELDYNKFEADVRSHNQFIRGVIRIYTLNGVKINFLKRDMIYYLNVQNEIQERERKEEELIDNCIYGRFQFTKSIMGIDRYFFNQNISLHKKHKGKLHALVSKLIYEHITSNQKVMLSK